MDNEVTIAVFSEFDTWYIY